MLFEVDRVTQKTHPQLWWQQAANRAYVRSLGTHCDGRRSRRISDHRMRTFYFQSVECDGQQGGFNIFVIQKQM